VSFPEKYFTGDCESNGYGEKTVCTKYDCLRKGGNCKTRCQNYDDKRKYSNLQGPPEINLTSFSGKRYCGKRMEFDG